MANEATTVNIVREMLTQQGYTEQNGFIVEEQGSDKKEIRKLLSRSSKNNKRNL